MRKLPVLLVVLLAACTGDPPATPAVADPAAAVTTEVDVLRSGWHTDLVLPVAALHPPLAAIAGDFPGARYLVFGFGNRHYVLATHKDAGELLLAPLPGAGLILVTGLQQPPAAEFGADRVAPIAISQSQSDAIAGFIWGSLEHDPAGDARPYLAGRYAGNLYYASSERYSGLFTCNTWTARGLRAGGIKVGSFGVLFAGQVWRQARARSTPLRTAAQ